MKRKNRFPDISALQNQLICDQHRVHAVALMYREPYYQETVACLSALTEQLRVPVTYVERHRGTGSLTKAMNEGFRRVESHCEFVWFVTDVTFQPQVAADLVTALVMDAKLAAVHPTHPSDHLSHRPDGDYGVVKVPYLEFTAPVWRTDAFRACGLLDENHWYWMQDLLISKRSRELGYDLGVLQGSSIGHAYRGRQGDPLHPITKMRYDLRRYREPVEQKILEKRFGPDWRDILWCRGAYAWDGNNSGVTEH